MNFSSQIMKIKPNDAKDYAPEVIEILQFEGNNACADCVSLSRFAEHSFNIRRY